ncbi:response regulator [Cohnella boryungensis]|uniref:Response regulator n=1 Tax=Cohnella boryungensis TaxID=768479 RepID=A0ABV8S6R2_9BACL
MINALVVDDEKLVRKGFLAMADWQAYDIQFVGEAKDGHSALTMLDKHDVDLLFVDISMPGMSGFELMEQVRTRHPQIRSVVLTCHHEFDYVQEALRLGAIDYIVKTLLNRNNVDETLGRIMKRLSWEMRDARESPVQNSASGGTERGFAGAAVFCSFGRPPRKEALLEGLPDGWRPVPLADSVWMAPLSGGTSEGWIRELPATLTDEWMPLHVLASSEYAMTDAKSAISREASSLLFYWHKPEPPGGVQLEALLAEEEAGSSHNEEARKLLLELENMRWPFYGTEWKRLIDRIEEARPEPHRLLDTVERIADDWRHYFDWDPDSLERWRPERDPQSWKQVKGWLSDMAADVQRRMVEQSLSREVAVCLLQAMIYMKRNACTELNQNAVAHHVGMSRSYFSQCYKKFTGFSFGDTLRQMRIEQAKAMLLQTDLSVYEISSRIGFEDDKHFSRVFRERVGYYPTEFRLRGDTGR